MDKNKKVELESLTENARITPMDEKQNEEVIESFDVRPNVSYMSIENGVYPDPVKEAEQNSSDTTIEQIDEDSGAIEENIREGEQALDDARRIKVVSPGMLVAKRFFRNKLAIVGIVILIVLFAFCFIGSWSYRYKQDQIFTTEKEMYFNYAYAAENKAYDRAYYFVDSSSVDSSIRARMNSYIVNDMIPHSKNSLIVNDASGNSYSINKINDDIYTLSGVEKNVKAKFATKEQIGTYISKPNGEIMSVSLSAGFEDPALETAILNASANSTIAYNGNTYRLERSNKVAGMITCVYAKPHLIENATGDSGFVSVALANINNASFEYDGKTYHVGVNGDNIEVFTANEELLLVQSKALLHYYVAGTAMPSKFEATALYNSAKNTSFLFEGVNYNVKTIDGVTTIYTVNGTDEKEFADVFTFVANRYSGEDTIAISVKRQMQAVINEMAPTTENERFVEIRSEKMIENPETGELEFVYDEDGNIVYGVETFEVQRKQYNYVFRNIQSKTVADIDAPPSKDHPFGLDGNGMDVLARIMYGGRISLVIGFIVVFIEIILGTIMGGISGYFGGVIDNIIMRIVDIFYCIPSMPILIILGAMFDQQNLPNIERVIWMMAVIGFLGWPGIARLVRGQILSLREQDFMVAAEVSGLSNRRRIFKHLVPNVMPQLIVQATMGLGSVIILESTLSFLGLGVKYPMATWGQIINSVSSIQAMVNYTYIWIPVGCLICLAVIAFNFVGDGLRDAFDPRMKR